LRNLSFVILAVLLVVALAIALWRAYRRTRRSADASWDDLLKRLSWVDRDAIATIALDVVNESGEPLPNGDGFTLEHETIWNLLGGLDGLETIERNCQVLVDLATYVQRFHPEALVIAEQLRLNAREIQWHVERLRGAAKTGNLQASFDTYAQRAVVSYYMMTRNVLELYSRADFSHLADLQQAI
jgi:hypothetical protein